MTDPKTTDPMVAALLRERASYMQSHRPERAEMVTAELKRRGYEEPPDESETNENDGAPRGRRTPGKRSTASAQE